MNTHNFIYSDAIFSYMSLEDINQKANDARRLYEHRQITLKEFRQILDRLDTDAAIIEHNL